MIEANKLSFSHEKNLLNADIYQYNTLSDGVKKIYTNDDELTEYGSRGILDPDDVSYFGLFINGVLQPKVNYEIQKGLLILKTEDVPIKGSAIIISFITFEDKGTKSAKLNSASVEGILPSGVISGGPVTDTGIYVRDNINNYLRLESALLCGPACIPSGCKEIWDFTLTVNNISHIPITDIVATDTILLDVITDIKNTFVSCGIILIQEGTITWNIGTLNPGESAAAKFRVQGFFQAAGARHIDRSMASGNTVSGPVSADIICTNPINVSQGLDLTQTIISGPAKVNAGTFNTWRIEIKISNLSINTVSCILIRDILFIDCITCIKTISVSHGAVKISDNEILWKIDTLRESDTSVLMVDIAGCFCLNGCKALGIALGAGCMYTKEIFSNPSQDFQIVVSPSANMVKQRLLLETHALNDSMVTFSDCTKKWTFSLNITNTSNEIMKNLLVIDYILLDEFKNIIINYIASGIISVSDNSVIWDIEELLPCETLTAVIEVDGFFNTTGCRPLSRAIAKGSDSDSCVISDIISPCPAKVFRCKKHLRTYACSNEVIRTVSAPERLTGIHGNIDCPDIFGDLTIEKYIVSGPSEVNANQINTWRVEIRVSNYGHGPASNVIMTDALLPDELTCFNPISFTKGTVYQENNIITWDVGTLNSGNTVVLLAEVTGSFYNKKSKILDVSDYQYNAVSNGIKKEFTNTDELLVYGNYGIPDPNDVSFFNLFINGVLQPETNYYVEAGLLTLTVSEPPEKNVPIILEYLVIKNDDNQLLKAETSQYNTLSNGGKTYTDADELTVYGDRGIIDPDQASYNHLFVNGVIQPGINYVIEPGILTLTVAYAPVEESPILVKFISLYL